MGGHKEAMTKLDIFTWMAPAALALAITAASPARAADMPPSAQKLVQTLKLAPDLVEGWEKEHVVPEAWIAEAKKVGELRINGSWSHKDFREISKPFLERYPFVEIKYARGSTHVRARVPLIAFKEGRFVADVITGIDSSLIQYRQADALTNMRDLPNLANIPDGMGSATGNWVGFRMRFYGMSYNPKLVKKEDMPRRWEDLITATHLHGGKIALWRGVTSWALPLWEVKGEAWMTDFIHKLFNTVKPQLRKEGARALVALVGAGEFDAMLPTAAYQVKLEADKGAGVAFHALDILPVTASALGVLKGTPGTGASKLFVNWLISKEGQLAQFAADGNPPIHKELQARGFTAYPDEIRGKKIAFRDPELLGDDMKALYKILNPYLKGGTRSKKKKQ